MTAPEPTAHVFLHAIGGTGSAPEGEYIDLADMSDELLLYYTQQGNQRAADELVGRAELAAAKPGAESGDKK